MLSPQLPGALHGEAEIHLPGQSTLSFSGSISGLDVAVICTRLRNFIAGYSNDRRKTGPTARPE